MQATEIRQPRGNQKDRTHYIVLPLRPLRPIWASTLLTAMPLRIDEWMSELTLPPLSLAEQTGLVVRIE